MQAYGKGNYNCRLKGNIIDVDQVSTHCPNGWYICAEDNCGACCSSATSNRRKDNLLMTGGAISSRLNNMVIENKGHYEKDEWYCYRCGNKLDTKIKKKICMKCNKFEADDYTGFATS